MHTSTVFIHLGNMVTHCLSWWTRTILHVVVSTSGMNVHRELISGDMLYLMGTAVLTKGNILTALIICVVEVTCVA